MLDSTEKLVTVLETLGSEGIDAYYMYLFLDYASMWILFGLCSWGARSVWNVVKKDFN